MPSFGDPQTRGCWSWAWRPGGTGANRTGRPFTGDGAGWMLYETLLKTGFARGTYEARPDDGLRAGRLHDHQRRALRPAGQQAARPVEEHTCRPFLAARLAALPRLKVIVTLGDVSRRNVLRALGLKADAAGRRATGSEFDAGPYRLFNSYHCSRLNTNTGRLTPEMFEAVFARIRAYLDA